MKNRTYFKGALAFLVTTLIASLSVVNALTISPAKVELLGDPGQAISESFLLINETDGDQTYYTSVEAFDSQGESGTPNFTLSKEGLPSWVVVEEKVVLKKGERAKVPYSINVPTDAESGGHFAAIFLSTQPPSADGTQVSVGAKVGMLILLKVTGDIKEQGGLKEFAIKEEGAFLTSTPINFFYRFRNDGNDRVKPEGEIVIKNMIGSETARLVANKSEGNVLPNSTRLFDVKYGEDEAPQPSAPFFDHVAYEKNHFAFGMYTANLSLTFGNSGSDAAKVSYFIFPWHLMTVVTVVAVVIILLLMLLLKKYNQWIIKQARAAAKQ
ncbi:MAG: hypothetical protein KBC21_02760 [Candidatus Pacebacteria bacterium]|nr:hypothetical protein [Candidatus Paceibacterota bacterium]